MQQLNLAGFKRQNVDQTEKQQVKKKWKFVVIYNGTLEMSAAFLYGVKQETGKYKW